MIETSSYFTSSGKIPYYPVHPACVGMVNGSMVDSENDSVTRNEDSLSSSESEWLSSALSL